MLGEGRERMTIRRAAVVVHRVLTGIGSAILSLYGIYVYAGANLNLDTLLMSLYCFLPMLSFPVFLLSFRYRRTSVASHCTMAVVYCAVYSMLNWRSCSELGICSGVAATVLETLTTRPALLSIGVAGLNLAPVWIGKKE
jgi:hypothetical protein